MRIKREKRVFGRKRMIRRRKGNANKKVRIRFFNIMDS